MRLPPENPRIYQYAFVGDYLYPVHDNLESGYIIPELGEYPVDIGQVLRETVIPYRMPLLFSTPANHPWDRVVAHHRPYTHLFPDVVGELYFNGNIYTDIGQIAVQCFPHVTEFLTQAFNDATLASNTFMAFYLEPHHIMTFLPPVSLGE